MIKQRRATDCGIATLANALSIPYDEALQLYGADRAVHGVTIQHTASILFSLGYLPAYVAFDGFTRVSGISITPATPQALKSQPAIIEVLTPSGTVHQVFFDGEHVIDPCPSVEGPQPLEDYVLVDALFVSKANEGVVRKSEAGRCSVCEAYSAVMHRTGGTSAERAGL